MQALFDHDAILDPVDPNESPDLWLTVVTPGGLVQFRRTMYSTVRLVEGRRKFKRVYALLLRLAWKQPLNGLHAKRVTAADIQAVARYLPQRS
jgi:hypothetical protein